MTLAAGTAWEVRTTGSDNSGGGYNSARAGATTDYSLSDTPFDSGTNLTVDATTNTDVAPDGFTPSAADIGNLIQITSGAGFTAGFYEIVSIQAGKWRLDRSPAATTTAGGVWALGGALASLGIACGGMVAGNTIWVKSGTYTITSASSNVANGCATMVAGVTATVSRIIGYDATRGDGGTPPLFQASGITAFTLLTLNAMCSVENVSLDGASLTSSRGVSINATARACRCKAVNFKNSGFASGPTILCEASGCSGAVAFSNTTTYGCTAHDNTLGGFGGGVQHLGSLAFNNTGASGHGFATAGISSHYFRCTAYGNGGAGFQASVATLINSAVDCLAVDNTGAGFGAAGSFDSFMTLNCGIQSNGSDFTNLTAASQFNNILLGSNPFRNSANNDFALNNNSTGGALARAASFLGSFLDGSPGVGHADLGALQSTAL